MAAHARDGSSQESVESPAKDPRWPLAEVVFTGPTRIPGMSMMATTLEAGVMRLVDGKEWHVGPMWYDPVNRLITLEGASYPLERVHYFRRAKAAITKKPPSLNLDRYAIGKRP